MRISDWSSDVCSSDLAGQHRQDQQAMGNTLSETRGPRVFGIDVQAVEVTRQASELDDVGLRDRSAARFERIAHIRQCRRRGLARGGIQIVLSPVLGMEDRTSVV